MRVLHVTSRYWPARGGAELYLQEIGARLVADGHQVTVVTSDALDVDLFWNPARRRLPEHSASHSGVQVLRFPVRHLPLSPASYSLWRYHGLRLLARLPLPGGWLARLARGTPWVPELWRWLARSAEPVDLVAAAGILYEPFVDAAQQFARRRRVPFVALPLTHLGAGRVPGRDPVSRYYTMPHQVAMVTGADAMIAMTRTEKEFYALRGLPAERIHVLGAGVTPPDVVGGDGERFRSQHGIHAPLVAFISTLTHDKGAEHLVQAVQRLWAAGQPVDLALAGAVLAPFQAFLGRLPAGDRQRLHVLGPISEADKRDLLAAADLLAMPSRTDSFGIAYLEAWANRKPVIAARAWGMSDVITDGHDGLLVRFGDPEALAGAIRELVNDPARRASLGEQGQRKVQRQYTWDRVYAGVSAVYAGLAGSLPSAASVASAGAG